MCDCVCACVYRAAFDLLVEEIVKNFVWPSCPQKQCFPLFAETGCGWESGGLVGGGGSSGEGSWARGEGEGDGGRGHFIHLAIYTVLPLGASP